MAFILKQDEQNSPFAEICGKAGIRPTTSSRSKRTYCGLLADEMRRLEAPEDESSRFTNIVPPRPEPVFKWIHPY